MIQNLAQLKKNLKAGTILEITAHCRPDYVGQKRKITLANTQGFYSVIPDEPQSKVSLANGGKGSVLWWSKAPFWSFENGCCSLYDSDKQHTEGHLIMSFHILNEEAA